MSRPSLEEIMSASTPHQPVDIIRDILRDAESLPRLMEVYYLMQEPGLLEIMRGLGALPDADRKRLQTYIQRHRHKSFRVRELPTGAVILEFDEKTRLDATA